MGQGILRQVLKEKPRDVQQRKRLGGLHRRGGLCAEHDGMGQCHVVEMGVDCRVKTQWEHRHLGSWVQNTRPETKGNGGGGSTGSTCLHGLHRSHVNVIH